MDLSALLREGLNSTPTANRPAGIEIRQDLRAAAGMTVKPPSYEGQLEIHKRQIDGEVRDVLELDSVGSAANRIEEVLLELDQAGQYPLPVARTTIDAGDGSTPIEITTLEAPHRSFDAWIRLSVDGNGTVFEHSERGRDLSLAHLRKLDAILETSAHDLLFGAWDSHRKGGQGQVRIPRSLTTTLIGLDPRPHGLRAARRDPLNLGDASERTNGKRLSELGLSSIPPNRGGDEVGKRAVGITEARYLGFLSFASLRRLGFEAYDAAEVRVLLALLALYGLLLRADAGWDLRAQAALVADGPMRFHVIRPTGEPEAVDLDVETARQLLDDAVARVGVEDRKISLQGGPQLNDLVAKAITSAKKREG